MKNLVILCFILLGITGCSAKEVTKESIGPTSNTTTSQTTTTTTTSTITTSTTKKNINSGNKPTSTKHNNTTQTTKNNNSTNKTTTTSQAIDTVDHELEEKKKEVQYSTFSDCNHNAIMKYAGDETVENTSCPAVIYKGQVLGYKIIVFYR